MFDGICEAIHREMDELNAKYETGAQLTEKDLASVDTMAHALKNIATYTAMIEGERRVRPTSSYRRY